MKFPIVAIALMLIVMRVWGQQVVFKKSIPEGVRQSLELAGDKRLALETLIAEYAKHPKDSLKLKAAHYLIDNMKWHRAGYAKVRPDTNFLNFFNWVDSSYYAIVKNLSVAEINSKPIKDKLLILEKEVKGRLATSSFSEPELIETDPEIKSDLEIVDASFIKEQIEHAFTLRQTLPHLYQMPFGEFCEYLLPNRLMNGLPFRNSSQSLHRFFSKYLGDVSNGNFEDAVARYNLTVHNMRQILGSYPFENRTGFEELFFSRVKNFDCFSIAQFGYTALNACGIPVLAEYNIAYQLFQGKHSQLALPSSLGAWQSFSPESELPVKRTGRFKTFGGQRLMNLFSIRYAAQKSSPYFLKGVNEYVPDNLASPCIKDVTDSSLFTLPLTLPFNEKTENRLCYLATFSSATGLVPVTWTIIKPGTKQVMFKHVIPDRIYFPIYYEGEEIKTFGPTFYLQYDSSRKNGFQLHSLEETKTAPSYFDAVLTRKFPEKPKMKTIAENLIGTMVLAADSAKGKKDTLYVLNYKPNPIWQQVSLNNKKAYKIYWVVAPTAHPNMNISEIEFLSKRKNNYENTCDATPLPSFSYEKNNTNEDTLVRVLEDSLHKISWKAEYDGSVETAPGAYPSITFKLNKPQVINAIRFVPLNANNGIVPGNEYQLKYWEAGNWQDFEYAVIAESYFLPFKNLPKGKLYWLRNLTTGKEEYPFVINEKGQQVFLGADIPIAE